MKVLVTGDRKWIDRDLVWTMLDTLASHVPVEVVEGGAPGADTDAREWAETRGRSFREYAAQWQTYGPAAGPRRNQQMLDEEHPELVLAFHDDYEHSKGTRDMCRRAVAAGVETILIRTYAPPVHLR